MTIQAYGSSLACGVLAIPCVLRWLWETDRPVTTESADIGAGIRLPTYVTGPKTPGWWAMIILLIVIGMIFLMAVFSYLYPYGVHPSFWTSPPSLFWFFPFLAAHGLASLFALLARWLLTRKGYTLCTSPRSQAHP